MIPTLYSRQSYVECIGAVASPTRRQLLTLQGSRKGRPKATPHALSGSSSRRKLSS